MEQKLSESEQYLWHFIETHILEIPGYSIVKLSEQADVSATTIVRTMKEKGHGGFTSFKHHLEDKENQNINFPTLEKVDQGIRTAILKDEEEVTRTINMIEIGNTEGAIQKIEASRRIITFARGFPELIAQEVMVKFRLADKYCGLHADPEIVEDISKELSEGDVAPFASLNRKTQELVVVGKDCYDSKIGAILLTVSKHSSLAKYTEIPFVGFKSEGFFFPDYEVRLWLPLSILARILLDACALRMTTQAFLNGKRQVLLHLK